MNLLVIGFILVLLSEPNSASPTYRELRSLAKLLDVGKFSEEEKEGFYQECKQKPLELALVIDSSASIRRDDFEKGQQFLQDFVSQYEIGPGKVRVSAVTFGRKAYKEDAFYLDSYDDKESLTSALKGMRHHYGDFTGTGPGIKFMREKQMSQSLVRPGVPKVAVVLTDGNSQRWRETETEARLARDQDIQVFAVGVGAASDAELLRIAGDQDRVVKVVNYSGLEKFKDKLAEKTCEWIPNPTTTPIPTTTTPVPEDKCGDLYPSDINFVFNPASMGLNATSWVTTFISTTVKDEQLENGFQYGSVTGDCPDVGGFALNRYSNTDDIREHLSLYDRNSLPRLVQRTRTEGFKTENGARPEAGKIAVIFVDKTKMDMGKLMKEVEALLEDKVRVFVSSVQHDLKLQFPEGVHQLHPWDSPIMQSAELVQYICKSQMF